MGESNGQIDNAARKSLKELSKIQPKEFEKHFREWMERDDVARSLQAKLRSDLITNFNTTHLGKQLLSHTCTAAGRGGTINRLTLSPLVLALNTLVAEFLYSQNCHFSLSVFCAEVPYRNTIPDFENTQSFRFTKLEIGHIVEAISGSTKCEDLKKHVAQSYRHNKEYSLLYTIINNFVQQYFQVLPTSAPKGQQQLQSNVKKLKQKKDDYDKLQAPPPSLSTIQPISSSVIEATIETDFPTVFSAQFERHELAREQLTNYRLLNKYLMVLSKRVKEMVHQCEHIYQNFNIKERKSVRAGYRTTRFFRPTPHMSSYESVCQSLDRVTKNLKKLKVKNTKDKYLRTLLEAIRELSRDFSYCAAKFENFKDKNSKLKSTQMATVATETDMPEKPYSEWIHEMRYSTNGRKFLDRIAISLRKALNKQKSQLMQEAHIKQQHQQELIKLRYRQKYMELLTRNNSKEQNMEARMIGNKIEKQLKQYESRYNELFAKLSEYENRSQDKLKNNPFLQALNSTQSPLEIPNNQPTTQLASDKQSPVDRNLLELRYNNAGVESRVDEIVMDANQRIKELEHEDTLVEQNIQDFIQNQQQQREMERDVLQRLIQTYAAESQKIAERYEKLNELGKSCETNSLNRRNASRGCDLSSVLKPIEEGVYFDIEAFQAQLRAQPFEFRNAITDAKETFFVGAQRSKEITPLKDRKQNDKNDIVLTYFNRDLLDSDIAYRNQLLENNKDNVAEEVPKQTMDTCNREMLAKLSKTINNIYFLNALSPDQCEELTEHRTQPDSTDQHNLLESHRCAAGKAKKMKSDCDCSSGSAQDEHRQHKQKQEQQQQQQEDSKRDQPACPEIRKSHRHHKQQQQQHKKNRMPNSPELKTKTSSEATGTPSTSTAATPSKLQLLQSMAKMQQLFSNDEQQQIIGHAEAAQVPAEEQPIKFQKQQKEQNEHSSNKNLIEIRSEIFEGHPEAEADGGAKVNANGKERNETNDDASQSVTTTSTTMHTLRSNERRKQKLKKRHELIEQLQQQLEEVNADITTATAMTTMKNAFDFKMDEFYDVTSDSQNYTKIDHTMATTMAATMSPSTASSPPTKTKARPTPTTANTLTVAAATAMLNTSQEYSDSFEFSEDGISSVPKQHQQLQKQLHELEKQRDAVQRAKLQFQSLTANVVAFNASESDSSSGSSQGIISFGRHHHLSPTHE